MDSCSIRVAGESSSQGTPPCHPRRPPALSGRVSVHLQQSPSSRKMLGLREGQGLAARLVRVGPKPVLCEEASLACPPRASASPPFPRAAPRAPEGSAQGYPAAAAGFKQHEFIPSQFWRPDSRNRGACRVVGRLQGRLLPAFSSPWWLQVSLASVFTGPPSWCLSGSPSLISLSFLSLNIYFYTYLFGCTGSWSRQAGSLVVVNS